jgi:hypothetical protein
VPKSEKRDELDSDRRRELLTVLTAEHSNLQAARSAGVVEANSRTMSFFAALSGLLVALALVAQVEQLRDVLIPIAIVLAWTVLYIGLLTFLRLVELTMLDSRLVIGINRIRHRYLELLPTLEAVEVLSAHDDLAGITGDAGLTGGRGGRLDMLAATPGMVGGIDGIIAGILAGLAAAQIGASPSISLVVGLAVGVVTDVALLAYGIRSARRFWRVHQPRFPTPQP